MNLFKDRAWLRSFLNNSFIQKGNRAHQFSTDVTFQMNICRAVQFWIMNYENMFSAVKYSFMFHDFHRCKRKSLFLVKYYPNTLSLTLLWLKKHFGYLSIFYMYVYFYTSILCITRLPTCVNNKIECQRTLTSEITWVKKNKTAENLKQLSTTTWNL